MSSQTKILVIHRRIFLYILLALFFVCLLICLLFFVIPQNEDSLQTAASFHDMEHTTEETQLDTITREYVAGIYSTCLQIADGSYALTVYLDENQIKNITLQPTDEIVSTMYPFIEPTLQNLSKQILENQTIEHVTYDTQFRYTSLALLQAIQTVLQKAQIQNSI